MSSRYEKWRAGNEAAIADLSARLKAELEGLVIASGGAEWHEGTGSFAQGGMPAERSQSPEDRPRAAMDMLAALLLHECERCDIPRDALQGRDIGAWPFFELWRRSHRD